MSPLVLFLVYSLALLFVMLIAELAYKVLKLDSEWTRKIAHIGSGIVALSYPLFIQNHLVVLALTISFTIILYISKKFELFSSIFSVDRHSYGELFFVWSSWLLFWLYQYTGNPLYFYLPFGVVVFADPAAALVGKAFPVKKYRLLGHQKSIGGSLAFFAVSFILAYFLAIHYLAETNVFLFSLTQALILTLVEAVSHKGWDNFTIPLVSVILIYIWL